MKGRLSSGCFLVSLTLVGFLWGPSPAAAQKIVCADSVDTEAASRAERLRACRQEKAERLQSPKLGFFERITSFISNQPLFTEFPVIDVELPGVPGLRPVLGGLRSGSGLTGGLRYEPIGDDRPYYAVLAARASFRRYWGLRALVGYQDPQSPLVMYGFGTYQHIPQDPFYGIGPETERAYRANYRWDRGIAGALLGVRPASGLQVGGHASYQHNRLGTGKDEDCLGDIEGVPFAGEACPDVRQYADSMFVGYQNVPGIQEGRYVDVDYLTVAGYAEYDTRVVYSAEEGILELPDDPTYKNRFAPIEDRLRGISLDADRGIYLAGQAFWYQALDDFETNYNFMRYEMEAQQYIPIRHGFQVFAFRQFLSLSQTAEGGKVPFYMMRTIGGGSSIRGFNGFRFRDRNLAVVNTEYRWEAWFRMDMALFLDAGYAFNNFSAFQTDEVEVGGGLGFRFRSSRRVIVRLDLAWSRVGMTPYLKLGSFL